MVTEYTFPAAAAAAVARRPNLAIIAFYHSLRTLGFPIAIKIGTSMYIVKNELPLTTGLFGALLAFPKESDCKGV